MTPSDKSRTPKTTSSKTSARESGGREAVRAAVKGERIDLLAAALLGAAVGAAAALIASGSSRRPPIVRGVQRGARRAGALGTAAIERIPGREAAGAVREYIDTARGAIDDAVEQELRELRRAVRRQRKRIGV